MNETNEEQEKTLELDIMELLLTYVHRWWLILMFGILGGVVAIVITYCFITPMYSANVTIYVNNTKADQNVDILSSSNLTASQQLVNTYITIITSNRVMGLVSDALNGDYSVREIQKMTSAAQVDNTEIFRVNVAHESPEEAARIANAIAAVAPEEISRMIDGSSAWVIDDAEVPQFRYKPSYTKNTIIGGVAGGIVIVIYLTLNFLLDVRIKDDEELTTLFNLPVIGMIPDFVDNEHFRSSGAYKKYDKYGYNNKYDSAGAKNDSAQGGAGTGESGSGTKSAKTPGTGDNPSGRGV